MATSNTPLIENSHSDHSELQENFTLVSNSITQLSNISDGNKLRLYAQYKQATVGNCNTKRPGFFDQIGRAKWDNWNKLVTIDKHVAMQNYIDISSEIDSVLVENVIKTKTSIVKKVDNAKPLVPVVSTLGGQQKLDDEKNKYTTLNEICQLGDIEKVKQTITNFNKDTKDEIGMSPIHWACDRGHLEVVIELLAQNANIDEINFDGQTALHFASTCGHLEITKLLLERGANIHIKDQDGLTAKELSENLEIKALFI